MTIPSIICLGMNEESEFAIDALHASGANIRAVAGLPSSELGAASDYIDHQEVASRLGVCWIPVTDINDSNVLNKFHEVGADYLFILGWSQLLSATAISYFPKGVIGSHPSKLPYGRGGAPVPWTILENLSESAVSLFLVGVGVDDGVIVKQKCFGVPTRATAREVYNLVKQNLAAAFVGLYKDMVENAVATVEQDLNHATWRAKRVPLDGFIEFSKSAVEIDRLIRAVSEPYPGAYSYIDGKKALIWSSDIAVGKDLRRKGSIGQVLSKRGEMLLVQAGDVPVWIGVPKLPSGEKLEVMLGMRFGFSVEDEIYRMRERIESLEQQLRMNFYAK